MENPITTIDTNHEDMIHDTQFDYYSRKLATCSSDRTVKVFDVVGDKYVLAATLTGHEGPVWQVAWAHPKFGVLLASCSYDGSVHIYRESQPNSWTKVYEHRFPETSVNSIAWSPHEYGLILACASSDGKISLLEYASNTWTCKSFQNDYMGCNAVSWAPYNSIGSIQENGTVIRRLVTGSCDNIVRIWKSIGGSEGQYIEETRHTNSMTHSDWVRDVAWAPNIAMSTNIIASCSEDHTVLIWKQSSSNEPWIASLMYKFQAPVWRISWSITGNVLAVSSGDHKVSLWKQTADESWVEVSSIDSSTTTTTTTTTPTN